MVESNPVVLDFSLEFKADSNEFELVVSDVTKVRYQLEYATTNQNEETGETVSQAFIGNEKADSSHVVTVTQLAGSESSGSQYLHDVKAGSLELTAFTTDNRKVKITQFFEISSDKELELTEFSQTVSEAEVLGVQDEEPPAQQLAQAEAANTRALQPLDATPAESPPSMGQMLPMILVGVIGLTVFGVALGYWLYRRQQRLAQDATLAQESNGPIEKPHPKVAAPAQPLPN